MDNQPASNQSPPEIIQKDIPPRPTVTYTSTPPPISLFKKFFRMPYMNIMILAFVILLGGFMTYNFVVHQLTQLAGDSTQRAVNPTPTHAISPTPTPTRHSRH